MSGSDPRGRIEQLFVASLVILLTAAAMHWAMKLILEIWVPLAITMAVLVSTVVAVTVLLRRFRGW